eukprot:EG_transcript_65430
MSCPAGCTPLPSGRLMLARRRLFSSLQALRSSVPENLDVWGCIFLIGRFSAQLSPCKEQATPKPQPGQEEETVKLMLLDCVEEIIEVPWCPSFAYFSEF